MARDMYLKLAGIKGESEDSVHKDEIEIESFTFGVHQVGTSQTGGGGGAGKASFSDIVFQKRADVSSPLLMQACATGQHIATANLTVRKAGGKQEEYYKIKFTDILVSSFQNAGEHDEIPVESLGLNYAKIEFEYYPQKGDGTLGGVSKAGYDLKRNVKV